MKKILAILAGILFFAAAAVALLLLRYDFNRLKQPVAEAVRNATGRELTMGGDIDLSLGRKPALVVENIRLANAAWGSRPEMVGIGRLEVEVALIPLLRGIIEVERFVLIDPDILLETDAGGRSNLDFTRASKDSPAPADVSADKPSAPAALPQLAVKSFEIRNGRLLFRDQASGRTRAVLLRQVQAMMTDPASPLDFTMTGAYQDQDFTLGGRLGPLSAILDPAADWPVSLQAQALDVAAKIDGRIRGVKGPRIVNAAFSFHTPDLARVAALADLAFPKPLAMTLSGSLTVSDPRTYRLSDLNIKLGDSDLSGTVTMDPSSERARITAQLTSKRIDATALKPLTINNRKPQAAASQSAAPRQGGVFPDAPIPLAGLNAIDGTAEVRIEQLRLPRLTVDQLKATATLDNGRLAVAPLSARIADGNLDGDLTVASGGKTPAWTARLAVGGLDLGRVLREQKQPDLLEGRVDADLNLNARGASVAAMMAGTDGHLRLAMKNGQLNRNLSGMRLGDIAAGLLAVLHPAAQQQARTQINCLVARLDAVQGVAGTTVLFADTPYISVTGDGSIDLRSERLDIALKPTPKEGLSAGKFGKLSMSLSELARQLKLGGTLAAPSLTIDPTQTAMTLGKTIGGVALFGPAGVLSALAGVGGPDTGADPCQAALAAAAAGRKFPQATTAAPAKPSAKSSPAPAKAFPLDEVGKALKGLLGN